MIFIIQKIFNFLKYFFKNPQEIGGRVFKKKFLDLTSKELNLEENNKIMENLFLVLSKNLSEVEVGSAHAVFINFSEFFYRLLCRSAEIRELEWEIYYRGQFKNERSLREMQVDFINQTESFHQQVYATISSFIKLLTHIAPSSFKSQMVWSSTSSFLKFILNKFTTLNWEVNILLKSIEEYRVEYIDHTNHSSSYRWDTFFTSDGKIHIIYTEGVNRGNFIDMHELIPEIPEHMMRTPFSGTRFFVPPHHVDVIKCVAKICREILEVLSIQKSN